MHSDIWIDSWSSRRADRLALARPKTRTAPVAEKHAPTAATRCTAVQGWQSADCGRESTRPNTRAPPRPLGRRNQWQTQCSTPPRGQRGKQRTAAHPIQPGYWGRRARGDYPRLPAAHLVKKKARDSTVTIPGNEKKGKLRKSRDTSCIARPSSHSS